MSTITARVPAVDWSGGFARRWNGGNASVTHAFNALSFLFPDGEAFFVEVVREVLPRLTLPADDDLRRSIRAFVAQESIHGHQHGQYNDVLRQQGFRNVAQRYVNWLRETGRRRASSLTRLAVVCAYEHYTAVLGEYVFSHPAALQSAEPQMALVWGWHAAEETEHKAVCFDLYCRIGGGWGRRVFAFVLVTMNFSILFGWLYLHLLQSDTCLDRHNLRATVIRTAAFFLGRHGVAWHLMRGGWRYLRPGFHPWQHDNRHQLDAWLAANRSRLIEIEPPSRR